MTRSFKNRALAELWTTGRSAGIDGRLHERIERRLARLDSVPAVADMNVPGFDFHALRGFQTIRHTVHVNGPWSLTFSFDNGDARQVDFEQDYQGCAMMEYPAVKNPPWCPTHPGELLREDVLPAVGRSKLEIAQLLDISRQHLHDILACRKPATAVRLGKMFGLSAES